MPKMSTDSLPKEGKLARFNYEIWTMKMEGLLVIKNLWTSVEGDTPSDGASEDEKKRYKAKDHQARFLIIAAIDNSFYRGVRPLKTSKEVWDHLGRSLRTERIPEKLSWRQLSPISRSLTQKTLLNTSREQSAVHHYRYSISSHFDVSAADSFQIFTYSSYTHLFSIFKVVEPILLSVKIR